VLSTEPLLRQVTATSDMWSPVRRCAWDECHLLEIAMAIGSSSEIAFVLAVHFII
jgi:hypothetical protein